MASHATNNAQSPLTYGGFLATAWSFTTLAVCLTVGRFIIRERTLGKLQLDDYTHGFATAVLLAYIGIYTALYPLSTAVELWGLKQGPEPSKTTIIRFLHLEAAGEFLFWIILYTIKFSFLIFYRHLFGISHLFMRYWWGVVSFTSMAFFAAFLTVFWSCGAPSKFLVLESCLSPSASSVVDSYAETCVALNIASDIAIMVLPIWMIRGLNMRTRKKIGLAFLFSLALVVIVLDCLRIALGDGGGIISLASLWDILEPTVAVSLSALITYRALFTSAGKSSKRKPSAYVCKSSQSQRNWKDRITSRRPNEGYELSDDEQRLHAVMPATEAPRVLGKNSPMGTNSQRDAVSHDV